MPAAKAYELAIVSALEDAKGVMTASLLQCQSKDYAENYTKLENTGGCGKES